MPSHGNGEITGESHVSASGLRQVRDDRGALVAIQADVRGRECGVLCYLVRTTHRPMRPILEPVEALSLIADQPGMQRLPRHPTLEATCAIDNPSLITAVTA